MDIRHGGGFVQNKEGLPFNVDFSIPGLNYAMSLSRVSIDAIGSNNSSMILDSYVMRFCQYV